MAIDKDHPAWEYLNTHGISDTAGAIIYLADVLVELLDGSYNRDKIVNVSLSTRINRNMRHVAPVDERPAPVEINHSILGKG